MPRFAILAQSSVTASALGVWLELLGEPPLQKDDSRQMVWDRGHFNVEAFESVAGFIELLLMSPGFAGRSSRAIVLVDSVRLNQLNPLSSGWDALIARLILAFPEVRWVFGVISGIPHGEDADKEQAKAIRHWHALSSLLRADFDPLMDGTGLRALIREQAKNDADGQARHIPLRQHWAAALDDEVSYAYLHAYTAYRFGYRSFAVTTDRLAFELFGKHACEPAHLSLTLEDYYLGWPDKAGERYSNLEVRSDHLPKLGAPDKAGPRRYFITSGHQRGEGRQSAAVNGVYRRRLKDQGRGGKELLKPIAGIFNLWNDLGLFRGKRRGLAPGFVWPPEQREDGGGKSGHSAPGALLMISEHLISRAESLASDVRSVVEAVRGAVLASSALELLGAKTPTTARDALELKHRFEVLAECQFGGVQFNLDLKARFEEIREGLEELAGWYNRKSRDVSVLNGEALIVSRLMTIFRDQNEFDEEEECRHRMRRLQTRIWFRKRRWNPLIYPVALFRWYIESILFSLSRFVAAITVWVLGLTVAFIVLKEIGGARPHPEGLQTFGQALSSFFGGEAFASAHPAWIFISVFGTVMGFVHLGIFISYLYSAVSRK